jgi:hypothetical protein
MNKFPKAVLVIVKLKNLVFHTLQLKKNTKAKLRSPRMITRIPVIKCSVFLVSLESNIQEGPLIIIEINHGMKATRARNIEAPSAAAIAENINPINPSILYATI